MHFLEIEAQLILKTMFGQFSRLRDKSPAGEVDERSMHLNRSDNMQNILGGSPQINDKYFIDSLERFQKDFAQYDKQQRAEIRQTKNKSRQMRQQRQLQLQNTFANHNSLVFFKQRANINYKQQLCDIGLKKTGLTNGIPINPINHQYIATRSGQQLQREQNEKKMNDILRLHHIQTKGTCGYNPINGIENTPVSQLGPSSFRNGIDSRLREYQDRYSLRVLYY